MSLRNLLCAILTSITGPAFAQTQIDDPGELNSFVVVGAAALPEFEGADRLRAVPLIVSRFSLLDSEVEIEGLEGRVDLIRDPVWRAGPAIGVVLPRNENIADTAQIVALPDVDVAAEIGAFAGFRIPFGALPEGTLTGTATVRHDVAGSHNGLTVDSELEYFFAVNRMLRIGVSANASFATNDYFDTYFSIDADGSAASGLAQFDAGGGARDVGLEIYSILSFSKRWGVFSRLSYNRLLGDAENSPIVQDAGSADQFFVGTGLFFRF
ncbi:MAG: MipA/OmpV family protein [Pseudomonadota bacterium]